MVLHKKSFAKINYNLKVYEKMQNGFHSIQSYMQKVSLYDEMYFEFTDDDKLTIDVQVKNDSRLNGANNIAYQAAWLYCQKTETQASINISIKKNIFMAAGLAGGSSNAATCLRALNEYFKALSFDQLLEIAQELGSDVPFFLYDDELMFVKGRGTECKPEQSLEQRPILLINPGEEVSTQKIYQSLDRNSDLMEKEAYREVSNWQDMEIIIRQGNDMQAKAIEQCPEIDQILNTLSTHDLCEHVQMSGSGATVWALFASEENVLEAARALKNSGKIIFTWTGTASCFNRL